MNATEPCGDGTFKRGIVGGEPAIDCYGYGGIRAAPASSEVLGGGK